MDNKISFIAGWFLTAATTITASGILNAVVLGLLGGFFGIIGKEAYYYTRDQYRIYWPKAKAWVASKIAWIKSKL